VPARGPVAGGRDGGRRLGSRRAGCTPGRCAPARRCVIPAPLVAAGMVPPPLRAAMLAAAVRSWCPWCPLRAAEVPPGGLGCPPGTPWAGGGRAPLVNQLDGDPGGLGLVRQGADEVADAPVPGPLAVAPARAQVQHAAGVTDRQRPDPAFGRQDTTVLAASCWACRTRRRCRASAARSLRRDFDALSDIRQRRGYSLGHITYCPDLLLFISQQGPGQ